MSPGAKEDAPVTGRHASRSTRACDGCRKRKLRCDGDRPCAHCASHAQDCTYAPERDGRKPVSKAYVSALEARVKVLEGMLGSETGAAAHQNAVASSSRMSGPSPDEPARGAAGVDRLQIDAETGGLVEYGPTSAFKHLNEARTSNPAAEEQRSFRDFRTPLHHLPSTTAAAGLRRPPVPADLPSPELREDIHTEVLRLFFAYFNPWCQWVDEGRFRADMLQSPVNPETIIRPRRTAYYSPLLHNVVLSVGLFYLDCDSEYKAQLAAGFARRAREMIDAEVEAPLLSSVMGILLLGSHHTAVLRHSVGYIHSGTALRLAQALGLGMDCSHWVRTGAVTLEMKQSRDRVFWTGYIQDKFWSIYVGRASSVSIARSEIAMPDPDPEEDEQVWVLYPNEEWSVPSHSPGAGNDRFGPSIQGEVKAWTSTTYVWTCKLALIAERVLDIAYSMQLDIDSLHVQDVVSDINLLLQRWYDELPEPVRIGDLTSRTRSPFPPAHVLVLHAAYHFMLILLNRPWFSRFKTQDTSTRPSGSYVPICEQSARKIVEILQLYDRCPGLRFAPISMTQFAFAAGTIHLLCAANATGKQTIATEIRGVRDCIAALRSMGGGFWCASQSGAILEGLLNEWCPSDESTHGRASSTTASDLGGSLPVAQLLRDNPTLEEELKRLGWVPPPSSAVPSGHPERPLMSYTSATVPQGPLVQQQAFEPDWSLFSQLFQPPADPNMLMQGDGVGVDTSWLNVVDERRQTGEEGELGSLALWPFGLGNEGNMV